MEQRSQAQFEYLLATGFAFATAIVVLFIVFNFASYIQAMVKGRSVTISGLGLTFPIKEEFKIGFIAGMVVLYLIEHAVFLFFYVFIAKKRKEPIGEMKMAEEIFKGNDKEKETTF